MMNQKINNNTSTEMQSYSSVRTQPLHADCYEAKCNANDADDVNSLKMACPNTLKTCIVSISIFMIIICNNIIYSIISSEYDDTYHMQHQENTNKFKRILGEESSTIGSNSTDSSNQSEIFCDNAQYSAISDLSYTYSLETKMGTDIPSIIRQVERFILSDLSDALLFCRSGEHKRFLQHYHSINVGRNYVGGQVNNNEVDQSFLDSLIDDYSLKIVGISSMPDDYPSTKSTCIPSAEMRNCTVVLGALNLFLKDNADLASVRYATRYAIRDAMSKDEYVLKIEGLENINYLGPTIVRPSQNINSEDDDFNGQLNKAGGRKRLTKLEVVVIATLISTMVGLFGTFVLFKKVYSNQNCFAHCDGTGIDRDYIEDCNKLGIIPVGETGHDSDSTSGKSNKSEWNKDSVANHDHRALSAIDENSISTSDIGSLYSGAVSISTNKSSAQKSIGSFHSEQTMVISNGRRSRHRTPVFGESDDKENHSTSDNTLEMI